MAQPDDRPITTKELAVRVINYSIADTNTLLRKVDSPGKVYTASIIKDDGTTVGVGGNPDTAKVKIYGNIDIQTIQSQSTLGGIVGTVVAGTGVLSYLPPVAGDIIVADTAPVWAKLAANSGANKKFLCSVSGAVPAWDYVHQLWESDGGAVALAADASGYLQATSRLAINKGSAPIYTLEVFSEQNAPVAHFVRNTTATTGLENACYLRARTNGDMGNTFGPKFLFTIEDNSGVLNNNIGEFGCARVNNSDNTGMIIFSPYNSGSAATAFIAASYQGRQLCIGRTSPLVCSVNTIAWLEIGAMGAILSELSASSSNSFTYILNGYYNSGWKYITNGAAVYYRMTDGKFDWWTAPSGTAGNAISWTKRAELSNAGIWTWGAYDTAGVLETDASGVVYTRTQSTITHKHYQLWASDGSAIYLSITASGSTGIGPHCASATNVLDVIHNYNGPTDVYIQNNNAGSNVRALLCCFNSASNYLLLYQYGSGKTSSEGGITLNGPSVIRGASATGLLVNQYANGPMYLATNNIVRVMIDNNGLIAIGGLTLSPDSLLHVFKASAGSVTAASGTILTIENNDNAALSFLTPDSKSGKIVFGFPSDNDNVIISATYDTYGALAISSDDRTMATFDGKNGISINSTKSMINTTIWGSDATYPKLYISHSAWVGIGTNFTPSAMLEIYSPYGAMHLLFTDPTTGAGTSNGSSIALSSCDMVFTNYEASSYGFIFKVSYTEYCKINIYGLTVSNSATIHCHSGTGAPTSSYSGALWLDTTSGDGTLKIYANGGWRTVAVL